MAGGAPEIGVRLTAQGVQDVINAFQRVRKEGKTAGVETASAFQGLNDQVQSLVSLIPALSAGIVVEQVGAALVSAAKNALDYATNIGKASEKTGVAVGPLSALALAAREAGVDQDGLTNGLVKLERAAQDASEGVAKPKKAFDALGISLTDLKTKDPAQLFALVAQKLGAIESPGQRAQAIISIFGKSGAELVPVLERLADEGFGALTQRAQQLGVYLSDQFVAEARRTKAELSDLSDVTTGMATQFLSGLLPATEQLLARLTDVAGTGGGFKSWGASVGDTMIGLAEQIELLLGPLDHLGDRIKGYIADAKVAGTVVQALNGPIGGSLNPFAKDGVIGKVKQAYDVSRDATAKGLNYDPAAFEQSVRARYDAIRKSVASEQNTPAAKPFASPTASPDGTGVSLEQTQKNNKAYLDLIQARVANELAILKLRDDEANAQDQRDYAAGLLTLDQYYDRREARINAESDKELQLLQQKRAQAAAAPVADTAQGYERQKAVEALDTQIAEVQLKRTASLKAAEDDRSKDRIANGLKELELQKELQTAAGDAAGAARTGLDIEIEKYEELLKAQGKSLQEIAELSDAARSRGTAKIDFASNYAEVQHSLEQMDAAVQAINDQVANGSVTQLAGARQIHDLEQQRLTDLQGALDLMQKQVDVSKDPAQKDQLDKLSDGVKHLKAGLQDVTTPLTYLQNQFQTVGAPAIDDFFTSILDGSKSAGEAFGDLAKTFEQAIAQMITKMLIFYSIEAVVGLIAPNSDFAASLKTQSPFKNSLGFKTGGFTPSVGENNVAGVVHGDEWVANAEQTRKYRTLFEAITSGQELPFASSAGAASSSAAAQYGSLASSVRQVQTAMVVAPIVYADAGAYASSAAADNSKAAQAAASLDDSQIVPVQVNVVNGSGQPAETKQSKASNGGNIIDVIIGKVDQRIASGGSTGQVIANTFGLNRAGTRRS